jgi:endonuclease YncB( thermonuclease family)
MYASIPYWLTRRPVASALVGVVALSVVGLAARDGNARPSLEERHDLTGTAAVVDGDTIEIDGRRVRLEGIDAPESGQSCARADGRSWNCGAASADALAKLVAKRRVACADHGADKYGRMLGVCFVDGVDINAQMVRTGMAWAFVKYSKSYVTEEAEARSQQAGIWQGEAQPAWAYRETRWAGAEQVAPSGCAIKGNITSNGRIYHMPWSTWYAKVKIDLDRGERWFCSEDEAAGAGWRPAQTN